MKHTPTVKLRNLPQDDPVATTLAVEPAVYKFGMNQEKSFGDLLEATDRTSNIIQICHVNQVTMRSDGTFQDGLKPTTWALYQLCRSACPGLYRLLIELTADGIEEHRLAAIGIFNQLMRLNFRKLIDGKRMLCDNHSGLIEALLGTGYKTFSNYRLFEQVQLAMAGLGRPTTMYEGVLNGRWMLVRYYEKGAKLTIPTPESAEQFFTGFHFSNHEGGLASLKGSNIFIRKTEKVSSMLPTKQDRYIRHAGVKFHTKFQKLLQTVLSYEWDLANCKQGINALLAQPLGLGLSDPVDEAKRETNLSSQIQKRRIPVALANRIIASMMVQGYADEAPRPLQQLDNATLKKRTGFDLYVAMSREAKKCSIAAREELERTAYLLSVNRFRLR